MGAFNMKTHAGIVATTIFATGAAWALPKAGEPAPDAALEDVEGRTTSLSAFAGKAVVVVYEDKDSAALNKPLKEALARLTKEAKYRDSTVVLPFADVSSYDFWPAKGFARDAIREEAKKIGTTIYCDWSGAFRQKLGIREGTSSVILLGKDGRVLLTHEGAVPEGTRARFVEMIKAQIEG